ncbi:hypothetical protein SDJN02_24489, partial [Cucurbita argyrosperma subsp. argyrosperma]
MAWNIHSSVFIHVTTLLHLFHKLRNVIQQVLGFLSGHQNSSIREILFTSLWWVMQNNRYESLREPVSKSSPPYASSVSSLGFSFSEPVSKTRFDPDDLSMATCVVNSIELPDGSCCQGG